MNTTARTEAPRQASASRTISYGRLQQVLGSALLYLVLALGAVIFFMPFYWVITASLKLPAELRAIPPTWWPQQITFANYPEVWRAEFARYFLNSFIYSGGSTIIVIFTSSLIGYVLVKDPSRLGNLIFWFLLWHASNTLPL